MKPPPGNNTSLAWKSDGLLKDSSGNTNSVKQLTLSVDAAARFGRTHGSNSSLKSDRVKIIFPANDAGSVGRISDRGTVSESTEQERPSANLRSLEMGEDKTKTTLALLAKEIKELKINPELRPKRVPPDTLVLLPDDRHKLDPGLIQQRDPNDLASNNPYDSTSQWWNIVGGGATKGGNGDLDRKHDKWNSGNPNNPFNNASDFGENKNVFGSYNPMNPLTEGYTPQGGNPPDIPGNVGDYFTGAAQHGTTEGTGSRRSGEGPAPSRDGQTKQGGGHGTQQCDANEGKYYDPSGNSQGSGGLEQDPAGKDPFYHGRDALEVKQSDGSWSLRGCSVDGDGGGKATRAMLWLKGHIGPKGDNEARPNDDTRGVKIDRIQEFNAMQGGNLSPDRGVHTDDGTTVDQLKYHGYIAGIRVPGVDWDAKTKHGKLPMDPLVK